jgi:hypothetical protein
MDKRLNFVLFQYFNTIGGPPRWDSLTRWAAEWLKIENINFKNILFFLKIVFLILKIFFNSENNNNFLK